MISSPIPLLGDGAIATARDLVVGDELRIGASSVELAQGVLSDEPTLIAGIVPIELADLELRFTSRDADGFITDLEKFELEVEAFVADDAFDDWPFDVVLQLGGDVIRRDTPPAERRVGFTAAVDSLDPLRVRPIDLGPITLGIEGLGAPAPADPDDVVPAIVEGADGLELSGVPREPDDGFGFVVDAVVTIDGYADGVLQPGIEALVNLTYGQIFGQWLQVELKAQVAVAGTESSESVIFVLPVAADDVELDQSPPGVSTPPDTPGQPNFLASPFGFENNCADPD
ncbi:MAG: hypothetical protein AAGE94_22530 [Acidobacteriota bacterium]